MSAGGERANNSSRDAMRQFAASKNVGRKIGMDIALVSTGSRRAVNSCKRTLIFHTNLSGHMLRVDAARRGTSGVQILTMGQLAARLAGGFLQPIDADALLEVLRTALRESRFPDFDAIQDLPGMARAVAGTLDKIWRAGIDLSTSDHSRVRALHALEVDALRHLPPSMKRPHDLVSLALGRLPLAPRLFGAVEIHGHSEMSLCWRPLLAAMSEVTKVTWVAQRRPVPQWLDQRKIEVRVDEPHEVADPQLISCASPYHEALEAIRWMRGLLASGKATPDEIAIAATAPGEFDDALMALAADANLPIHFVHGVRATTQKEGQTAAALAQLVVNGLSQERVRRLFALLDGASPAIDGLPGEWTRLLPQDAPLTTLGRWKQVFAALAPSHWPDGVDRSSMIFNALTLIDLGHEAAPQIGETLLPRRALLLWHRALVEGPAEALPTTIASLRVADNLEPASHVIWTSAISLASAPRPFVRLLALNSGRWPRRISEDRLIPDHVIPIETLDPLPIAEGDRRDYHAILASAREVSVSLSRRDEGGRMLGRSPLIAGIGETYLSRARTPEHAASESDRLFARPMEFEKTDIALSGTRCWRDWLAMEVTPHDGLIAPRHPQLAKVFGRPMSATSLGLLLRDPIRFVWRYALGWKQPDPMDDPLGLDALAFGELMHAVLRRAVDRLEAEGGLARANATDIEVSVAEPTAAAGRAWEIERPTPPSVLWRASQERVRDMAFRALNHPLELLPGQRSWTEVAFGAGDDEERNDLPWDPARAVEIPGAGGVSIHGFIDRLDLSASGDRARVIDYKSGRIKSRLSEVMVDGGRELQRCLYASAVKTRLAGKVEIEAALLYPNAEDGEQAFFPLWDVEDALARLAQLNRVLDLRNIALGATD